MNSKYAAIIIGLLFSSLAHSQRFEFSSGVSFTTTKFHDVFPYAGRHYDNTIYHNYNQTKLHLATSFSFSEGVHLKRFFLSGLEYLQWQHLYVNAKKTEYYRYLITYSTEERYTSLLYEEQRANLGVGINGEFNLTPLKSVHLYIGLQTGAETPMLKKVVRDDINYTVYHNGNLAYDSTYKASSALTFKKICPFASLSLRSEFMLKENLHVNVFCSFSVLTSPVVLDEMKFQWWGINEGLSVSWSLRNNKEAEKTENQAK